MSFVIQKARRGYLQRRYVHDGTGPEYGPADTAFQFLDKRSAEAHAKVGERAVPKPGGVPIVARENPRGAYTMVLVRGRTPIAARETDTSQWDWVTAAGLFRDSGVRVQSTDRIGFLNGRWTRKGRPIDGGWSFRPFSGQGVDAVTVPYATTGG